MIEQAMGYALPKGVEVFGDSMAVRLLDNWEAAALKKLYRTPQCYFTKGMLEGFLRSLTGEMGSRGKGLRSHGKTRMRLHGN